MTLTNERFLFKCIEHSEHGTFNFKNVAKDCGLATPHAAYMKYNRMKTKFDVEDGDDAQATPKSKPATPKTSGPKKGGAKKRKISEADENGNDDEDKTVKGEEGEENEA